jgi:hypothetical protein
MSDSLNDFIHAGAVRMVEDESLHGLVYLDFEMMLRRCVEYLILNDAQTVSAGGWTLTRKEYDDRVHWSLDRKHLTFTDFDNSETQNALYSH